MTNYATKTVLLLTVALVLAACTTQRQKLNVIVSRDHNTSESALKSRPVVVALPAADTVGVGGAAKQRTAVVNALKNKGFIIVAEDLNAPDTVHLSFALNNADAGSVTRTFPIPISQTTFITSRQGNRMVTTQHSSTVGYRSGTVRENHNKTTLHMVIRASGDTEGQALYRGVASIKGRCADMPVIFKTLLTGLLHEFPGPSGQKQVKAVPIDKRC